MSTLFTCLLVAAGILFGVALGCAVQKHLIKRREGDAQGLARRIVEEARKEAHAQKKEIILQGQNEIFSQKQIMEQEYKEQERGKRSTRSCSKKRNKIAGSRIFLKKSIR